MEQGDGCAVSRGIWVVVLLSLPRCGGVMEWLQLASHERIQTCGSTGGFISSGLIACFKGKMLVVLQVQV